MTDEQIAANIVQQSKTTDEMVDAMIAVLRQRGLNDKEIAHRIWDALHAHRKRMEQP